MRHARAGVRVGLAPAAVAALLLAAIRLSTNSIDPNRFSWDLRYYIEMAEQGFGANLASPFAYRYVTPLLARWLSQGLSAPVETGFAGLAYVGAFGQLLGVFVFTHWYTRSRPGAWLAMLFTALSLFNIKFLLFDAFRPDHLAYPLILLQAYLALQGKFTPLLIITMVGCQIREFNVIPLIAYVAAARLSLDGTATAQEVRHNRIQIAASFAAVIAAFAIPRLLIPVGEDFQFASFTRDGILRALLAPLIASRDVNFLYSIAAYALPVLMLAHPMKILAAIKGIGRRDRIFLATYSALVLVFSFLGGTDFFRFSTFLMLPQAVLVGVLAGSVPVVQRVVALASVFVFNRMWLPFPMDSLDAYLDFYGGHGSHFGRSSLLRLGEWAGFVALGFAFRWAGGRSIARRSAPVR